MSGNIALSATEFSVLETDGVVSIAITRTGDLSQPTTVEYATTVGSTDFDNASAADVALGTRFVTIPAGADSVVVDIEVFDDDIDEGLESFSVSIIGASSGTLLFPRTARVDILDDERPEPPTQAPSLVSPYDVDETSLVTGLVQPISFEFSPINANRIFVAEKAGVIRLFDLESGAEVREVLDITAQVNNVSDRGVMDIALHPDLENNPYLYVFYVVDPADTAGQTGNAGVDGTGNRYSYLERYTLDAATGYQTVVEGSNVVLLGKGGQSLSDISGNGALDFTQSQFINERDSEIDPATGTYKQDYLKVDSLSHAGGSIEFGPDGALYVSTGDGTSYNIADPRSVSVQDIDSLAGKILRIDPITGDGLTDNPFFSEAAGDVTANAAKVYQTGLRNPFSMSFDDDGQLFITNTGWTNYESIFTGEPGANFGWPFFEGGPDGQLLVAPGGYDQLDGADAFYAAVENGQIDVTAPYQSFSHRSADPGYQVQAITGADSVIDSDKLPDALQGHYIFTDVVQGEVFSVSSDDRRDVQFLYRTDEGFAPVHFKQGPDGELYYANLVTGVIGRVSITEPAPIETGEVTFGDSTYQVIEGIETREDALAAAEAAGGTLLRIDSQAEQDFIMETYWANRGIYLDASDAGTEGVWRTSDGAGLGFTNWLGGGPDDGGDGQDYAILATPDGFWDDQDEDQADIYNGSFWEPTAPLVIIETAAQAPTPEPEPTPAPGETFNGTQYVRLEDGLTRDAAAAQAAELGGTLLVINSQAEQDFIMANYWVGQAIYLDINDSVNEGQFVSSDGQLTYANWFGGRPDNGGGSGQDYGLIATESGLWDDQVFTGADVLGQDGVWRFTEAISIVEITEASPPEPADPPEPAENTFGDSSYVLLEGGLTRDEALTYAEETGGKLLRVDSKEEQDYILETFWNDQGIYLDASDAAEEGVWVNSDGDLVDYTDWFGGGPNNDGNQDYAVIATAEGQWDDQGRDQGDYFDGSSWVSTPVMTIIEYDIG